MVYRCRYSALGLNLHLLVLSNHQQRFPKEPTTYPLEISIKWVDPLYILQNTTTSMTTNSIFCNTNQDFNDIKAFCTF